jgi:hypothetical protein
MTDVCFLKFGNTAKTGNCLNIVCHNLMIGYIVVLFFACFKVRVTFYSGHPLY